MNNRASGLTQESMDEVTVPAGDTAPEAGLADANNQLDGADQQVAAPDLPTFTVKVDGVETQVTQDELVNGYQRQSHFTQGQQQLAAERQRLAQAEAVWTAINEDPAGSIAALQEHFAEALNGTTDSEELDPAEAQMREIQSFMEQQRQAQAIAEVDAELNRIGVPHAEHEAVLQHALQWKIGDLSAAYRDYRGTSVEAQRTAADAAALAAKQNLPPVSGGSHAAGATRAGGKEISSFKDAFAESLAEAGVTSISSLL